MSLVEASDATGKSAEQSDNPGDAEHLNGSSSPQDGLPEEEVEVSNEIEDDTDLCMVCKDGATYTNNEIVFCDKCNIAVHQYCYGVREVPPGDTPYHCQPCSEGLVPHETFCCLCGRCDGALKKTNDGRWAHVACALWIPEVYFGSIEDVEPICVEALDPARTKLKCALCGEKGICVQCCGGRCLTAYHPWCMLRQPKRIIRRIVAVDEEDPDKGMMFQTFCEKHALFAGKPTPRQGPRNSSQARVQFKKQAAAGGGGGEGDETPGSKKQSKRQQERQERRASGGTGGRLDPAPLQVDPQQQEQYELLHQQMESLLSNSGLRADGTSLRSKGSSAQLEIGEVDSSSDGDEGEGGTKGLPPIHTFQEWPGQQIGEEMDLDHYWTVVGSCFPEEHDGNWLSRMISCPELPGDDDAIFSIPRLGSGQDDTLSEGGSECGGLHPRPEGRRGGGGTGLRAVAMANAAAGVAGGGAGGGAGGAAGAAGGGSSSPPSSRRSTSPVSRRSVSPLRREKKAPPTCNTVGSCVEAQAKVVVLLESENKRLGVHFVFKSPPPLDQPNGVPAAAAARDSDSMGTEWQQWTPSSDNAEGTVSDAYAQHGEANLASGGGRSSSLGGTTRQEESRPARSVYVALQGFTEMSHLSESSAATEPFLKNTRDYGDDSEVCMELRQLQGRLREWTLDKRSTSGPIVVELSIGVEQAQKQRKRQASLTQKYIRTQLWKQVASALERGVGDHEPGFNTGHEEAIPASWTIAAEGRPTKEDLVLMNGGGKKAPAVPEEGEDAVCMVCFDGHTNDRNEIVFCDGCNMSVHQLCYGLQDIPEGDFFCERCQFLQLCSIRQVPYDAGTVSCCLCPLLHGAVKHTTDSRWCHLACAMFAPGVRLPRLENMGPIDVTGVDIGGPSKARAAGVGAGDEKEQEQQKEPCCVYCGKSQGCLLRCSHKGCDVRFHFLCAWFAGAHLKCSLLDKSFMSGEEDDIGARGGEASYPSGLDLQAFCSAHGALGMATGVNGGRERDSQLQVMLRGKYRMKEDLDLELKLKPSKRGRGRPRKDAAQTVGKGGIFAAAASASSSSRGVVRQQPKQLRDDRYAEMACQSCVSPPGTAVDPHAPDGMGPVLQCVTCSARVHAMCYETAGWRGDSASDGAGGGSSTAWQCDACVAEVTGPACVLCPRRGGVFHATDDKTLRWVHTYCAKNTPGVVLGRLGRGEAGSPAARVLVDTRNVPKALRKQKCQICSRKAGVCVKCSHHGCMTYFHPLCGRLAGLYSRPLRPEEQAAQQQALGLDSTGARGGSHLFTQAYFCKAHTPHGLYQLSSLHWVDMHALVRLRSDLDNARLIIDLTRRREKVARNEWRTVCEQFDGCVAHLQSHVPARRALLQKRLDALLPPPEDEEEKEGEDVKAGEDVKEGAAPETKGGDSSTTPVSEESVASSQAIRTEDQGGEVPLEKPMPHSKRRSSRVVDSCGAAAGSANAIAAAAAATAAAAAASANASPAAEPEYTRVERGSRQHSQLLALIQGKGVSGAKGKGKGTRRSVRGLGSEADDAHRGTERAAAALCVKDMKYEPLKEDNEMLKFKLLPKLDLLEESGGAGAGQGGAGGGKRRGRQQQQLMVRSVSGPYAETCVATLQGEGAWEGVCSRLEQRQGDFAQILHLEAAQAMANLVEHKQAKGKGRDGSVALDGALSEDPARVLLDRQLKELLDGLLEHRVPVDEHDDREWSSNQGGGTRLLCERLLEIPAADVDLSLVLHRVSMFQYESLADAMRDLQLVKGTQDPPLAHDAERMYNLAQRIHASVLKGTSGKLETPQVQQGQMDVALAAARAEAASTGKRVRLPTVRGISSASQTPSRPPGAASPKEPLAKGDEEGECAACHGQRAQSPVLGGAVELPGEAHWYCPNCILRAPEAFVKCPVAVLKPHPGGGHEWRSGVIQAFEPISGKHRIVYESGEWDFLPLPESRLSFTSPTPLDMDPDAFTGHKNPHRAKGRASAVVVDATPVKSQGRGSKRDRASGASGGDGKNASSKKSRRR